MANIFKNASIILSTTSNDIYTCPASPASASAVIFSLYFSNINGTIPGEVTLEVFDMSALTTRTLGLNLPVPIGSTLEFGKITLEAGDILRAKSTTNSDVEVFANILEIV